MSESDLDCPSCDWERNVYDIDDVFDYIDHLEYHLGGELLTVAYDDVRHTREGMEVDCPECGENATLKFFADFGCHSCEYGPVDVRIERSDRDE